MKVLVVDDDATLLQALDAWLIAQGFESRTARNGIEAIDQFMAFEPEIVVMDLSMPGMDGFGAARQMRELRGDTFRLIAHSAYDDPVIRTETRQSGFDAHLGKPAPVERIGRLLRVLDSTAAVN